MSLVVYDSSIFFYLGVLFLLPVIFLLFLYPSTHNYNPLDIVKTNVNDVEEVNVNDVEDVVHNKFEVWFERCT